MRAGPPARRRGDAKSYALFPASAADDAACLRTSPRRAFARAIERASGADGVVTGLTFTRACRRELTRTRARRVGTRGSIHAPRGAEALGQIDAAAGVGIRAPLRRAGRDDRARCRLDLRTSGRGGASRIDRGADVPFFLGAERLFGEAAGIAERAPEAGARIGRWASRAGSRKRGRTMGGPELRRQTRARGHASALHLPRAEDATADRAGDRAIVPITGESRGRRARAPERRQRHGTSIGSGHAAGHRRHPEATDAARAIGRLRIAAGKVALAGHRAGSTRSRQRARADRRRRRIGVAQRRIGEDGDDVFASSVEADVEPWNPIVTKRVVRTVVEARIGVRIGRAEEIGACAAGRGEREDERAKPEG